MHPPSPSKPAALPWNGPSCQHHQQRHRVWLHISHHQWVSVLAQRWPQARVCARKASSWPALVGRLSCVLTRAKCSSSVAEGPQLVRSSARTVTCTIVLTCGPAWLSCCCSMYGAATVGGTQAPACPAGQLILGVEVSLGRSPAGAGATCCSKNPVPSLSGCWMNLSESVGPVLCGALTAWGTHAEAAGFDLTQHAPCPVRRPPTGALLGWRAWLAYASCVATLQRPTAASRLRLRLPLRRPGPSSLALQTAPPAATPPAPAAAASWCGA